MKTQEKSIYKIYIDTSVRDEKSMRLVEGENTIAEKKGDIDVVSAISDVLRKKHLKVSDISKFIPNLGPGSFTGLKMGVTVSNVLNWFNGKKDLKELDYPDYGGEPNISTPKK